MSGAFARCLAIAFCVGARLTVAAPIVPAAEHLAQVIDSLDVENHWLARQHIQWDTGIPDAKPKERLAEHWARSSIPDTHCSAFVAAAAKRVGIYILRPPDHGQILLANAQYDWLAREGAARGWARLTGATAAQDYANQGWFVVATYRNHHDDRPGHIAIVRPSDKDASLLDEEGPQITQAGATNYRSVSLRTGFGGHPAAWAGNEVQYYAHVVETQ